MSRVPQSITLAYNVVVRQLNHFEFLILYAIIFIETNNNIEKNAMDYISAIKP